MDYQKIYDNIVENAKIMTDSRQNIYKERHHIIPKCLGGMNNKSNLVNVTAREHFLLHYLLTKIHKGNKKLIYAFNMMNVNPTKELGRLKSSKLYSISREKFKECHPMKDENIKKKMMTTLEKYRSVNRCKFCRTEIEMSEFCNSGCLDSYNQKVYDRRLTLGYKPCEICGTLHKNLWVCSSECKAILLKTSDKIQSKTSKTLMEYKAQNKEKVISINKDTARRVNQTEKGKKISMTKRLNRSGNNNARSKDLYIYDSNDTLIDISKESFKDYCIEKEYPYDQFSTSYRRNVVVKSGLYKGWYVRKEQNERSECI